MRGIDEMSILDCIREMEALGHNDKATTWSDASYNAHSWDEHAAVVEAARRALANIRAKGL